MKKILIVSGHPDLNDSFANKTILEEVHKLLPEAEIACLDKLYPDFQIDVQKEQERLLRADIIVLQYPLFWYTAPSLLHRWIEKDFYPRILARKNGRQAERETVGAVVHGGGTGENVQPRRSAAAFHR